MTVAKINLSIILKHCAYFLLINAFQVQLTRPDASLRGWREGAGRPEGRRPVERRSKRRSQWGTGRLLMPVEIENITIIIKTLLKNTLNNKAVTDACIEIENSTIILNKTLIYWKTH